MLALATPPPTAPPAAAAALLDGMPHAAWLVALQGQTVVAANAAAGALFGLPARSLQGQTATALVVSPEDLAWWAAAAGGDAGRLESDTVVLTADGRALHVRRSIGLVTVADGPAAPSRKLLSNVGLASVSRVDPPIA